MEFKSIIVASLLTMPLLANAHPLKISNELDSPLTFTVNEQFAEEIGTIDAHAAKEISEETLNKLCLDFTQPCTITAYSGTQSMGERIADMKYNSEHSFEVRTYSQKVNIMATQSSLIFSYLTAQQ
jgi:hypothetical protein